MKTKPKLNIKLISLLLVSIFILTAVFSILSKTDSRKDNSSARITALEQSLSDAENEILAKNAVINQKNATIEEQNAVISNQRETINSQSGTIEEQLETISGLEEDISDLEDEIDTKDATIASQTSTINSQSSTISSQSDRIDELEEELSAEYNYQYTLDVNFYVDNNLYAYGKARVGGTTLVSPTDPVKTNYEFYGWSLSANGQVVDLSTTTINQNTNFYAIFSDNMLELENTIYSVYHSGSTLSVYMAEQAFLRDIYHALTLTDASNMTASEIRIAFGDMYDIENPNSMNYETFLKTMINRFSNYNDYYWITFRVDNSSICSIRASKTTGLLLRTPTSPTKENYTFDGWSSAQNGTVISNLASEVFNDNTTLYAVFSAVQQQSSSWNGIDLTGTTWTINSTNCNAGYGLFSIDYDWTYYDFTEYGFDELGIGYQQNPKTGVWDTLSNTIGVSNYTSSTMGIGDIISITGGTDATNQGLIDWLVDNAILISYNPNI